MMNEKMPAKLDHMMVAMKDNLRFWRMDWNLKVVWDGASAGTLECSDEGISEGSNAGRWEEVTEGRNVGENKTVIMMV